MDQSFFKSWLKLNKCVPNFQRKNTTSQIIKEKSDWPGWISRKIWHLSIVCHRIWSRRNCEVWRRWSWELHAFIAKLTILLDDSECKIQFDVKDLVKWQQDVSNYKISMKCKQSCLSQDFSIRNIFTATHATFLRFYVPHALISSFRLLHCTDVVFLIVSPRTILRTRKIQISRYQNFAWFCYIFDFKLSMWYNLIISL